MQPQHQRQRAGNQPAIIKMIMKETRMHMRFDQPPVHRIGRAADQEKRVTMVTKPGHGQSAYTMIAPEIVAMMSFIRAILIMIGSVKLRFYERAKVRPHY